MPWIGALTIPINAITKKMYRGINIPTLWAYQQISGLTSSTWGTYKQWQELGAQVKKGSKGTRIVFWKPLEKEVGKGEVKEEKERAKERQRKIYTGKIINRI